MPDPDPNAPLPFPGAAAPNNTNAVPTCGGCHFWTHQPPQDALKVDLRAPRQGLCRRFPPSIHAVGVLLDEKNKPVLGPHGGPIPNLQPLRPILVELDYCGEFQPAASPRRAR